MYVGLLSPLMAWKHNMPFVISGKLLVQKVEAGRSDDKGVNPPQSHLFMSVKGAAIGDINTGGKPWLTR